MKTRENTDTAALNNRILKRFGLTTLIGFFLAMAPARADDALDSVHLWQRNPLPTGQHLLTVTAGPDAFIAGGENGLILRSVHGAYWETIETPVFDSFRHSFFTGGEYTVAGLYRILTSPDGIRWEDRTPDFLGVGYELIYGLDRSGDRWAAVTPNAAYFSPDSLDWDQVPFHAYRSIHSIALGPDRLVVGLNNGTVLVHRLGVDEGWVEVSLGSAGDAAVSVRFAEGLYGARINGVLFTSADGFEWETPPVEDQWSVPFSPLRVGWNHPDSELSDAFPELAGCFDVACSPDGTWVGVGNSGLIVTSIDGLNWIRRDSGAGPTLYGMARINGRWIAGGADGLIMESADGIHWDTTTVGVPGDVLRPFVVEDRLYLLGTGYCGTGLCTDSLYVTTDGSTWTKPDQVPAELSPVQGLPAPFQAANPPIRIGAHWLLQATVGLTGTGAVFASPDRAAWEPVLLNGMLITSLGGTEGLYLAGDASGNLHRSTNLRDWETVQLQQGGAITSLLTGDGFFLASVTGAGGGIFASTNGVNWNRLPGTRAILYGGSRVDDSFWFMGESGTIIEIDAHRPAPLANLSVRTAEGEEAPPVIAGFVVEGSEPREVLIRAIGPGLASFGVQGLTAHPHLSVYSGDQRIAEGGAWTAQSNADQIEQTASRIGAFPLDRLREDAALLLTLPPGVYTAVASGLDSGTGQPLVEVYDAAGADAVQSALANSSNRGRLEAGATLVGGFVVRGDRDRMVLIRAIGPGLSEFGVSNPAADPVLTIWRDDERVGANDNWSEGADSLSTADAAIAAGAFDLASGSGDAGLVFQAAPGSYTVHVTAAAGSIGGEILLEIYHLER